MAYDKLACSRLCEEGGEFPENGVTETVCASLKNNTGFDPTLPVLQTNCESIEDAIDCLVGRMEDLLDRYDTCEWKEFMHEFIPNVHETLKAMNCSSCGVWNKADEARDRAECVYDSTVNLIAAIDDSVAAQSFVRYYRDNSGTGTGYEWPLTPNANYTLDMYMDADGDNAGSEPADRDYVVIASNCLNFHHASRVEVVETYYSSGDTRPIDTIRRRQGMHPSIALSAEADDWSWNLTNSTIIRKGEHLRCNAFVGRVSGTDADFRIHQMVMTWIPISPVGGIDTSDVMACDK